MLREDGLASSAGLSMPAQLSADEPLPSHVSAASSVASPARDGTDHELASDAHGTSSSSNPVDAPVEAITLPAIRTEDLPGDSEVGSSWLCSDAPVSRPEEPAEEWFDVPVTPLPSGQRQLSPEAFIHACEQALRPALLDAPSSLPLPVVPRRSGRIAKFCGKEVPGTLSWAQKTIICKLGLAERPEQIDDAALERYKAFFGSEVLEHRIRALRELFSKDSPRNVDILAHAGQLEVAC